MTREYRGNCTTESKVESIEDWDPRLKSAFIDKSIGHEKFGGENEEAKGMINQ